MQKSSINLLIVDNEPVVRHVLSARFTGLGYTSFFASNKTETLLILAKKSPKLLIIDINVVGSEIIYHIQTKYNLPIIILTSSNNIAHRINNLDLGAADFIIKPFSPKELEARVRSLLRHFDYTLIPTSESFLDIGPLVIDKNKNKVLKNTKHIPLTKIEYRLLNYLIKNAGKSLSRQTLVQFIWGYLPTRKEDLRIIDVHIFRLRAKLEDNPKSPKLILTLRGIGYMFQTVNFKNSNISF